MINLLNAFCQLFNSLNPEYFNKICFPTEPCKVNSRSSLQSLKQPLKKSDKGLDSTSYSVPLLWNKLQLEIKGEKAEIARNTTHCKNYYLKKMGHTS